MKKAILLASAISLSACQTGTIAMTPSEIAGTGVGAIAGAMIGSQFGGGTASTLFALTGAAVGGGIGYGFGQYMDASDMQAFESSTRQALDTAPDGQIMNWHNPQTGVVGTVRPVRSYYYARDGRVCRDYEATFAAPEGIGNGQGRACRYEAGPWQLGGGAS